MSDDFCKCTACGMDEPECITPETQEEEAIEELKLKDEFFAEDILKAAEKIKEAQEMEAAGLMFCKNCEQWTKFHTQHVEYHDGGYEINGHFVPRKNQR